VFCKPIINLQGMGIDSGVLRNAGEFYAHCRPGRFWTRLLTGDHVSTDIAVVAGRTNWYRHTHGIPAVGGTFDYWIIQATAKHDLERYLGRWIHRFLPDYTGMLNIETIGGRIIELHLRFADQWPDLYGAGWLEAMVRLYRQGDWRYEDRDRVDGFSVVLFGPHARTYTHPTPDKLAAYRAAPRISSVQITFSDDCAASAHSMPPGGFRLAVINSRDYAAAERLRDTIAQDFDVVTRQSGGDRARSLPAPAPVEAAG